MSGTNYISTASKCVLDVFMDAAFDGNFEGLIISGKPSAEQLSKAFRNILAQYYDLSDEHMEMEEMMILRRMKFIECRKIQMQAAMFVQKESLKTFNLPYPDGFCLLESNGYYPVWKDDKDEFLQQLDTFETQERTFNAEYEQLKKQLEVYYDQQKESHASNSTQSRKNFVDRITSIEVTFKMVIDTSKYTVEKYASLVKKFNRLMSHSKN